MNEIVISSFFGFVLGLLASFIIWFFTTKLLVLKIEFSENLSKNLPDYSKNPRYRFRIRNKGSRNIVDIDVYFRVRIKGLYAHSPYVWDIVTVPVGSMDNKVTILRPSSKDFYGITLDIKVTNVKNFNYHTFLTT
jgi:hypothetical protein